MKSTHRFFFIIHTFCECSAAPWCGLNGVVMASKSRCCASAQPLLPACGEAYKRGALGGGCLWRTGS